jgi:hypothetical protein
VITKAAVGEVEGANTVLFAGSNAWPGPMWVTLVLRDVPFGPRKAISGLPSIEQAVAEISVMRTVTITVPAAVLDPTPPTTSWSSWQGEASAEEGALGWSRAGAIAVETSKHKRAAAAWAALLARVGIHPFGIVLNTAGTAARVP